MNHVARRTLAHHVARRALAAPVELTAELLRRGMFTAEEKKELLALLPSQDRELPALPLGPAQFATLLSQSDTAFAARGAARFDPSKRIDLALSPAPFPSAKPKVPGANARR